jgi:polyphenol oxidase
MSRSLFTSRNGGVSVAPFESFNLAVHVGDDPSAVQRNREILATQLGIASSDLYFMNQIHGNVVAEVTELTPSSNVPTVDALFTTVPGKYLVTLIADCIPLLLRSDRAVAAVHVGRQGLVCGAFEKSLEVFDKHGIKTSEIKAELGPSICGRCYEVDAEMYEDVINQIPATAHNTTARSLNIEAGLISKLDAVGISWKSSGLCTVHDPGYFSYRRDGVTGRQAGVIAL